MFSAVFGEHCRQGRFSKLGPQTLRTIKANAVTYMCGSYAVKSLSIRTRIRRISKKQIEKSSDRERSDSQKVCQTSQTWHMLGVDGQSPFECLLPTRERERGNENKAGREQKSDFRFCRSFSIGEHRNCRSNLRMLVLAQCVQQRSRTREIFYSNPWRQFLKSAG
jgi:hypothetical protein